MSSIWQREPVLLSLYRQYGVDHDTVRFVRAVAGRYVPGSLERLVACADCEARRAAVFALGLTGDYAVNSTLGQALHDEDAGVRQLTAIACRSVWNRFGDSGQRGRLAEIVRLNATHKYHECVERSTTLLTAAPGFAEAWYQRGAAWFQLGNVAAAIDDWYQTLEHNPYQFVAATALGNAYLQLNNPISALEAFSRALNLNPDLEPVQAQAAALRRQIGE